VLYRRRLSVAARRTHTEKRVVSRLAISRVGQKGDGLQIDGISLQIGAVSPQIEGVSLVDPAPLVALS